MAAKAWGALQGMGQDLVGWQGGRWVVSCEAGCEGARWPVTGAML
jgi:hypothetical protein